VERYIPNHNESVLAVLDKFASTEGVVALLGAH
jgi:hypothetical protein